MTTKSIHFVWTTPNVGIVDFSEGFGDKRNTAGWIVFF